MYPSDVGSVRDFYLKDYGWIVNLVFFFSCPEYTTVYFAGWLSFASPCGGLHSSHRIPVGEKIAILIILLLSGHSF